LVTANRRLSLKRKGMRKGRRVSGGGRDWSTYRPVFLACRRRSVGYCGVPGG
jgi:hypothetical protein